MINRKYDNPKIGLYGVGLKKYWSQFPGLKKRLLNYLSFIEKEMNKLGQVYNFGIIDERDKSIKAGEWFNSENVDIIFCYSATYSRSGDHIALPKITKKPIIVLNLQPSSQINYEETTTGEWLAHCGACGVPEIANVYNRAGIKFNLVSGLLGLDYTPDISLTDEDTSDHKEAKKAWNEIKEWINAAKVVTNLKKSTLGFLGHTYSGMLDLYTDFTDLTSILGVHIEILEFCDLKEKVASVNKNEIDKIKEKTKSVFNTSEDSSADPLATKPTDYQLDWACKVAAGLKKMTIDKELDILSYFYQGANKNEYEKIQQALILGNSLLTASGVPCAGEGDVKTGIAMKMADILGLGGSFCEIVVTDYNEGTILMGHDGPFHLEIASEKPILRGLGVYHGKEGSGVSVEAKVKKGTITNIGLTENKNGKFKMILSKGESVDGKIMQIGNTMTPIKFNKSPAEYMNQWFSYGPIHHFALSIGDNISVFKKVADLLGIEAIVI